MYAFWLCSTVISGRILVYISSGFLKSGRSTNNSSSPTRWVWMWEVSNLRTALCLQVYLPCWADTGQLFKTWFSVSWPVQFGQESVGNFPHLNRLELVGKHLNRALRAKFEMVGFMSEMWLDQLVNSEPVRADLSDLSRMDCTVKSSSFCRRSASWADFAASAASFFETVSTRSRNGVLARCRDPSVLILVSLEWCRVMVVLSWQIAESIDGSIISRPSLFKGRGMK